MHALAPEHIGRLSGLGLEAICTSAYLTLEAAACVLRCRIVILAGDVRGGDVIGDGIADAMVITVRRGPC